MIKPKPKLRREHTWCPRQRRHVVFPIAADASISQSFRMASFTLPLCGMLETVVIPMKGLRQRHEVQLSPSLVAMLLDLERGTESAGGHVAVAGQRQLTTTSGRRSVYRHWRLRPGPTRNTFHRTGVAGGKSSVGSSRSPLSARAQDEKKNPPKKSHGQFSNSGIRDGVFASVGTAWDVM